MKLLIIGHGRHGKDTVAQMISDCTGLTFESSSKSAAKIFIYDKLQNKYNYKNFNECYEDRVNHRAEWHNLICEYNRDNKSKLAKKITSLNDMYVGMRSNEEIEKCIKDNIFDYIIGVFDPKKPLEPKDSFNIDLFEKSDIIFITGDLDKVRKNVELVFSNIEFK